MKKIETSEQPVRILRQHAGARLLEGHVPHGQKADLETAIREVDERLLKAQAKDAE